MNTDSFFKKRNIYKYTDPDHEFFQVILSEFILSRTATGKKIDIKIDNDVPCIRNNSGKKDFKDAIAGIKKDSQERVAEKLKEFDENANCLSYRFPDPKYYFRHANGGVLPVLRIKPKKEAERENYFCLFYREIDPIGWNIANGASDCRRELFHPEEIVLREFNEELLITDPVKKLRYVFDLDQTTTVHHIHETVLKAWDERNQEALNGYEPLCIPVKWIEGPDAVAIQAEDRKHYSKGFFLSITPEDNAIELDKIGFINISGDVALYDGELNSGRLVNAPIGLFKVDTMEEKLKGREFFPDRLFFNGEERRPEELEAIITDEFIPQLGSIIDDGITEKYFNSPNKYDLCPISRSIIRKFFDWRSQNNRSAQETEKNVVGKKSPRYSPENMEEYEIFISYKSEDEAVATQIYDYLKAMGKNVFFSGKSLQILGESDYAKIIDQALEKSNCLIVVGTQASFFDSGWISYEWKSFFNEIRSERKPGGKLFTFSSNVKIDELPYALRNVQNIQFQPEALIEALEILMLYLKSS